MEKKRTVYFIGRCGYYTDLSGSFVDDEILYHFGMFDTFDDAMIKVNKIAKENNRLPKDYFIQELDIQMKKKLKLM